MKLELATGKDIDELVRLVIEYHAFENILSNRNDVVTALKPLLKGGSEFGGIWFLVEGKQKIGYIAVCFGYSIEFGGRDCFIDEFYIEESQCGNGFGTRVIELIIGELKGAGLKAINMEVSNLNKVAQNFYKKVGFSSREKYHLMTLKI